ncbi:NUDIX domain-containing protein [Streptoverticillium reticulum]|uniref:NUDIX domain-containing protein n=1 Tax=Streptoverticillium reticulum TaxID=1433415 RepID=UPI0039BFA62B
MSDFLDAPRADTSLSPADPDLARYLATHPAPVAAVDALIRDEAGRLLIVDPVYKDGWDLPGGMLGDEGPVEGLLREIHEELGPLPARVGRLLALDTVPKDVYGRTLIASIYAVHLKRPVHADELLLQDQEVRAAQYVPVPEALARFPEQLRRRVRAALDAEGGSSTAHLRDGDPVKTDQRDHYALLPAPLVSATALVFDQLGRVLVVEHPYDHGDGVFFGLPGGMVLAHEGPRQGAAREIAEELGLDNVPVGRLLAVDHVPADRYGRTVVLHVFHVGPLTEEQIARLHFADGEVSAAHWLSPSEAAERLPQRVGRRVTAGVKALRAGGVAHLEEGVPHRGSPTGLTPAERARLEQDGGLGPADHIAVRPKALTASAVLFTDPGGRVLIVRPVYRSDGRWLLPGGAIDSDAGETPRQAAVREVQEELGISVPVGPLLATDWIRKQHTAEVVHVYDGGVLSAQQLASIRLPEHELAQWRLVDSDDDLPGLLPDGIAPRIQACLAARTSGAGAVELVNGRALAEGAVAIVYRPTSGELLLHERDEQAPCWPGFWSLLGGALEDAEFPEEAVVRELWEEAGLRVSEPRLVDRVWDLSGSQQLISVFAAPFDGAPEDLVLGEGRQLRFVPAQELGGYRMPPYLRAVVDRWLQRGAST